MLLCYVTDRAQLAAGETARRELLLANIREAARAGVDYVQLRERDLPARELEGLAREAVRVVRESSTQTRILINSRCDVALAVAADGVHLRSDDIPIDEARAIFAQAVRTHFVVGVSCHSPAEVTSAAALGADFVVFGPVFEKQGSGPGAGAGVEGLRAAVVAVNVTGLGTPVLAIGGVTLENVQDCLHAGAAGVAAIRLFQQGNLQETVRRLRALS
ncbi:MAG TPA: thiamine phosphate synthase [Terriglobales bacterium]|nr:thiamine phosphate synthase [Terriglobales bacterium]